MPARRKTMHDAEKAEFARQAELRKLAEEQERLRRLESEARQRLNEEWGRAMDRHQQRQMEIQRAITERELRLMYEGRELQLHNALEMKDCEARESRARVNGLQQSVATLQQNLESALRRASMLSNELELSQMRCLEAEQRLEAHTREAGARLRDATQQSDSVREDLRLSRAELERLRRVHAELEERVAAQQSVVATDGDGGDSGGVLAVVDPQSSDAETAVLLRVLHEEAERHREVARLLQCELDRKNRDEEKGSVLVSLLNSQLEAARDEGRRHHDLATERRRQLEGAQQLLDEARTRVAELHRSLDTAHAEAAVERRQFGLEVGVHTAQVAELTAALAAAQGALAQLREQFEELKVRSAEREQADFHVNVELKGEVEQLKKDLRRTAEEFRVASDEAYTTKGTQKAEIESLKKRLRQLQENAERSDREAFETIATLRAAEERLTAEKATLAAQSAEATRELRADVEELRTERKALQTHAADLQAQRDAIERSLNEKLMRIIASHDQLQEELQRVVTRHTGREKEFVENAIFLTAERETLRARVEELTAKLEQHRQEHLRHVQGIADELVTLRARAQQQTATYQKAQVEAVRRADTAMGDIERLQRSLMDAEARAEAARREREEAERLLRGELRERGVELNAAKRTIERYEETIGDASFKATREANERLRREVQQGQERIAALSNTVAAMKVESTVAETYRERLLNEQNDHYVRRIHLLEKMRQVMNPIFYELRSIAERNGFAGPLRKELDEYDELVRSSKANTTEKQMSPQPPPPHQNVQKQQQQQQQYESAAMPMTLPAVCQVDQVEQHQSELRRFLPQKPAAPLSAQPSKIKVLSGLPTIV